MKAHQHSTYVQIIGATEEAGPIGFFAVCQNCPWQGPDHTTEGDAERDGNDHAAATGVEARLV